MGFAERESCISACANRALRVVVREMGNDVDRIEFAEFIPVEHARGECSLPGRVPFGFPYPARFLDICTHAATFAGEFVDCDGCVQLGSVRSVDERTIEIIVWRRG